MKPRAPATEADRRDLAILRDVDRGLTYAECARRNGVSIAWVSKLRAEVRRDDSTI